jgi:RNA polymerase sigma-70 factor (ECF subfamily)
MPDPDGELLRRAAAGDEGAFLVLWERHRRPIFRFAYRMVGSPAVAEDLTHECFLAVLATPDRYDPERASLRTFLRAIARNLSFKHFRKQGWETLTEEPLEPTPLEPEEPGPLRRLLEEERGEAVRRAVGSLPPLQREVLILFEYEGQSLGEIADLVEADVGTVKGRLHRARERLRKTLAGWLSGGANAQRGRALERMA